MASIEWPPTTVTVKAARNGDKDAIAAICVSCEPRLRAFLRYQGVDAHAVDDVAADVVEVLITKLPKLRKARAFEAWFWTVARNRARTYFRMSQRTALEPLSPTPLAPDEVAIARDEHVAIRIALARLNEVDRTVLWLREVEGRSYPEIGRYMDFEPATARVRCHRARRRLAVAYADIAGDRESPARWFPEAASWQPAAAEG